MARRAHYTERPAPPQVEGSAVESDGPARLGQACAGRARIAPAPGVGPLEEGSQQPVIELVARAPALEAADDGRAGEIEVAQRIQGLVADELVGKDPAPLLQDARMGDDDGVVEGGPPGPPRRPHPPDPPHGTANP